MSPNDGIAIDLRPAVVPTVVEPSTKVLFDGFLEHASAAATALLLVARIARTRYYVPPGLLAKALARDPVVTAGDDRLRFESFSSCCGVAARYDVLAGGLDRPPTQRGSTNVDFTPGTCAALAEVRGLDPLHLRVGEAVTISTLTERVVEDRVPLPTRWVRGFAEAQSVSRRLRPAAVLSVTQARRLLRGLPRSSTARTVLYAVAGRDGLRLSSRPTPTALPLGGPERLLVLEPLLAGATGVTVYGPGSPDAPAVSAWQVDLPDARFTLVLSPTAMRGFSGEGGLLHDLADEQAATDAEHVLDAFEAADLSDASRLATATGLAPARVEAALSQLAATGQVGYDSAEAAYFHRELPWVVGDLTTLNPRLVDARRLVAAGAVHQAGDYTEVRSGGSLHQVRRSDGMLSCTCPWFAQHRRSRGPCKHVLAVELSGNVPGGTFPAPDQG